MAAPLYSRARWATPMAGCPDPAVAYKLTLTSARTTLTAQAIQLVHSQRVLGDEPAEVATMLDNNISRNWPIPGTMPADYKIA